MNLQQPLKKLRIVQTLQVIILRLRIKAPLGQTKINKIIKTIGSLVSEIQHSAAGITTLAANIKNIESVLDVYIAIAEQLNNLVFRFTL
ncbi:MAG: methyl-accepting chemotaxis protein [Pseudoalteromonas rhizosphaerae]|jgi:methyl-accepting chemotaxis protein|uniref:Methyl-accepting chemotaxis protein n=1 Tax=Pseudoalteromonas neustonica TaxID=1840331 RepID=A0ABY3F8M0_9GAMM|nr:hypothetical protein [Pseudoalteromonas neustonica]TVU80149.1 hypothetical protein FQP85_20925 [Pseudoalteromonas neustonica]